MVRVLNVITDTNIGGAGKVLLSFLSSYDKEKFDVLVALPQNSLLCPKIQELGIKYFELDCLFDQSFEWRAVKKLKKLIKELKPDIVHTHSCLSARIASYLCRTKVRIYTRHSVFEPTKKQKSFPIRQISGFINNTLSTHIIAVSEAAKKNLTDTGVNDKKIRVILNGTDKQQEISENEKRALRKNLNISEKDLVFGMFARLEDVKGHDYFIKAASGILNEYKNVKFLIVGGGSEEKRLKEQVLRLNLDEKVIFTGFVNDVHRYVNITDVCVNCSYGTEATSLALIEAMSLQKPIIATDYGGNPYIIKDGINGILTKCRDVPSLLNAMKKMLTDTDFKETTAKNNKEDFFKYYTREIMTKNIEALYLEAKK